MRMKSSGSRCASSVVNGHTAGLEKDAAFLRARQVRPSPFGEEDLFGVRVEGDGQTTQAERTRSVNGLSNQFLMTEMDAVEIADGDDRGRR
jgi:hypothetical protein